MINRIKKYTPATRSDTASLRQDVTHMKSQVSELVEKARNSGIMYINEAEIVTKIFTGLKVYLDPRDLSVTPHLALDGIYEGNISNAWLSLLKDNAVVLDIGANYGYFGLLAAQRTQPKESKVVLFEANPSLIPYIKKSLGVNWLNQQSTVECCAVGAKSGTAKLTILKDYVGSASLHTAKHIDEYMHDKMYVEAEQSIKVDVVSIDEYCSKHNIASVDLIKMDIEGFEEEAYKGMKKTVAASKNITMFIEFTKQSYNDPEGFYKELLNDFGNVYVIDAQGKLHKPEANDYQAVVGQYDDWVMPVFSKLKNLDDEAASL